MSTTKEKEITIKVSKEAIRASLEERLRSEHASLISHVIVDLLNHTETGLDMLYQSFSGIKVIPKFKPLQCVWIDADSLFSWRYDAEKTKNSKHSTMGGSRIKGVIKKVNISRNKMYLVNYTVINSAGNDELYDQEVEEHYLYSRTESDLI